MINAVVQNLSVIIGGTDYTNEFMGGSVSRDPISFGRILHWRCNLFFNARTFDSENIDDRLNSSLQRGQLIELTYRNITRRLRVDKAFYDPVTFRLTVNGIDILSLFSYKSPAESDLTNYQDQLSTRCGQPLTRVINYKTFGEAIFNLLVLAGIPAANISLPPLNEKVNFYLDKDSNESFVEIATQMAAVFLYWMEVDPNEIIIFHPFLDSIPKTFYYRSNQLISFSRIEPITEDPEIICVTGNKKEIELPKEGFNTSKTTRTVADDDVIGSRRITTELTTTKINRNPCVRPGDFTLPGIRFTVSPLNGRGSYISEVLKTNLFGLTGVPDFSERRIRIVQSAAAPTPENAPTSGPAVRIVLPLSAIGNGNGETIVEKYNQWNEDGLLERSFESQVSWDQYKEVSPNNGMTVEKSISVSVELRRTDYYYDKKSDILSQVKVESIYAKAEIVERRDNEDEPEEYKTRSRIEKERANSVVEYIENTGDYIRQVSAFGEKFTREVVYEGREETKSSPFIVNTSFFGGVLAALQQRDNKIEEQEGDQEYVVIAERQATSDSDFSYVPSPPEPEKKPPFSTERDSPIEAEFEREVVIPYLPRKKEVTVNFATNTQQLKAIAAWWSNFIVYKQNEYEASVPLNRNLWAIRGFREGFASGISGFIDAISYAWGEEGSTECSFRLLSNGLSKEEFDLYPSSQSFTVPPRLIYPRINRINNLIRNINSSISINLLTRLVPGYTITASGLPASLSLSSTGVLSGILTELGLFTINIELNGQFPDSTSFTISVEEDAEENEIVITSPPIRVQLSQPPNFTFYINEYIEIPITTVQGSGNFSFELSGAPADLELEGSTIIGVLSELGSFTVTFAVIDLDDENYRVEVEFNIQVLSSPAITTVIPPSGSLRFSSGSAFTVEVLNYVRTSIRTELVNFCSASAFGTTVEDNGNRLDFASGSIFSAIGYLAIGGTGFATGSSFKVEVFENNSLTSSEFRILEAQSMNIELPYIEQQVFD